MQNDPNRQLERLIQHELEKLSELQAPSTLIPRVIAAIEAEAHAPAWRRPWWTWPLTLKAASLACFFTAVVAVLYGSNWALDQIKVSAVPERIAYGWDAVAVIGEVIGTLGRALLIVCQSMGQPWLLALLMLAFLMYLTCVGVGTVCFRVAVNKR